LQTEMARQGTRFPFEIVDESDFQRAERGCSTQKRAMREGEMGSMEKEEVALMVAR